MYGGKRRNYQKQKEKQMEEKVIKKATNFQSLPLSAQPSVLQSTSQSSVQSLTSRSTTTSIRNKSSKAELDASDDDDDDIDLTDITITPSGSNTDTTTTNASSTNTTNTSSSNTTNTSTPNTTNTSSPSSTKTISSIQRSSYFTRSRAKLLSTPTPTSFDETPITPINNAVAQVNVAVFDELINFMNENDTACVQCGELGKPFNHRWYGGELKFDFGCEECEICIKRFGTAKNIKYLAKDGSSTYIKDTVIATLMGIHYTGGGFASYSKLVAFGAVNPISNSCYKRYKKINDDNNNELGEECMDREINKLKEAAGTATVSLATASDGRWSCPKNAPYVLCSSFPSIFFLYIFYCKLH